MVVDRSKASQSTHRPRRAHCILGAMKILHVCPSVLVPPGYFIGSVHVVCTTLEDVPSLRVE